MQPFPKYITYLLIAILIIGIALLYFAFTNKKETGEQSSLMMAMAKKLGAEVKEQIQEEELPEEKTQEEKEEILRIADKLCFGHALTGDEKKFQKKFSADIKEEVENSKTICDAIVENVKGEKLDEYEQDFYNANQEDIDAMVQEKLSSKSQVPSSKHQETIESTQSTESHNQPITQSPNQPITQTDLTKSSPPLSIEVRNQAILSLFEDGVPKSIKQVTPLYITKTGNDPGKNMYRIFGQLEGKNLLHQKIAGITYYGLPDWFDGKKLKPEYKKKIVS